MALSIKDSLVSSGYADLWNSQDTILVPQNLGQLVKSKLLESYKLTWKDSIFNTAKCLNYRMYKTDLNFEQYFNLLPDDLAMAFCHFRCMNHKGPLTVVMGAIMYSCLRF